MSKFKRTDKCMLTLLIVVSVSLFFTTPVSATEMTIEGGESYHGYVEIPGEAPESIYDGNLPVIQAGTNIPAAYDSRDYGYVTSIKNQNPYGTCWSFSTMAALESSLLKQDIYEDVDLSEYHLVYYNFNGVTNDPLGGTSNDSITYAYDMATALQAGGNVTVAYHALANWVGAVDEETVVYPTVSKVIEELPLTVESAYLNDIVHLQHAYQINKSDTAAIKQAIMDYGAVTASFYYLARYLNEDAYYINNRTDSNHGVTIVGWDDNYSKTNFGSVQPSADGAWLVKNSWDTWFGDEGYCWLSYEDTSLQETMCVLIGEKADNYDNNYQFDGSYMNATFTFQEAKAANVFRVQDGDYAEALDAVAFEIGSPNVNYSVQIYTDLTDESDPTSGTARLEQPVTGKVTFQGYHTIKLPQSVLLEPNQTFSVVIGFDKGGESFKVPVETSSSWNGINFVSKAKDNQSFLEYNNYDYWWDVGEKNGTNVRVKAFTTNEAVEEVIAVNGVALTPKGPALYVGDTKQMTAAVSPDDATNKAVKWSSSNPSVATVDANGLVTGVKAGSTNITVTTVDGGYSDTTKVNIMNYPVSSVSVTPENVEVYVGETTKLTATVLPDKATIKSVSWSSSDASVATVDVNGLVTAKKQGKAVITATSDDVEACTATATITVNKLPISLVTDSEKLIVGKTLRPIIYIKGKEQSASVNNDYNWTVEPQDVVEVSENGLITGVGVGTATVTCTHKQYSSITASVEVEIEIPFSDIMLTDWQYRYVVYTYQNKIMSGKGALFGMNDILTREEFVTVLYNYSGKPKVDYVQKFSDVDAGMWYAKAITWGEQQGVTSGYGGGTFGVGDNIEREQLVRMLYNHAQKMGLVDGTIQGELSGFADVDRVSPWAVESMTWAVQNGMMSGKPNADGTVSLDPHGPALRGECARIIEGFIESTKK